MSELSMESAGARPSGVGAARTRSLRAIAGARRCLRYVVVLLPIFVVVGLDVALRGARMDDFTTADWFDYSRAVLQGAVLWGVLLVASARRGGVLATFARVSFILFFSLSLGGQAYFFEQFGAYMNVDVSRFATDFTESVLSQLWADRGNYLSFKLPALLLSILFVLLAHQILRSEARISRHASRLAPFALSAAFVLPVSYQRRQASSPDILYMHALGGMGKTLLGFSDNSHKLRPRPRNSLPVVELVARPERPRNVVLVILESVRKDTTCNAYSADCKRTPATNRLFPERTALSQVRALDSSTAISMAVLWSGVGPHEDREVMHTWPLLFDYARQAGYSTAYYTSQNIMFGNLRLWLHDLGVDGMVTGNEVDPTSHIDLGADEKLFADVAIERFSEITEPYFVTIQLSNGHYPYLVHEDRPQPFRPSSTSKAPKKNDQFFNHFQNAVHQQDIHLARLLDAIKSAKGGERTVVVYTSDHGEAFREHHQMGHTFSLYDEEVLVPAWIDAPPGTLSERERENLEEKKDEFVFHPDLTATILDLLGVWDDPNIERFKSKMLGTSLLGPESNDRALPMTNCASVWSCAFENWGMMRGHMKLEARAWDHTFHCWDLKVDPEENVNLGADACGDLEERALEVFGRLPGKKK